MLAKWLLIRPRGRGAYTRRMDFGRSTVEMEKQGETSGTKVERKTSEPNVEEVVHITKHVSTKDLVDTIREMGRTGDSSVEFESVRSFMIRTLKTRVERACDTVESGRETLVRIDDERDRAIDVIFDYVLHSVEPVDTSCELEKRIRAMYDLRVIDMSCGDFERGLCPPRFDRARHGDEMRLLFMKYIENRQSPSEANVSDLRWLSVTCYASQSAALSRFLSCDKLRVFVASTFEDHPHFEWSLAMLKNNISTLLYFNVNVATDSCDSTRMDRFYEDARRTLGIEIYKTVRFGVICVTNVPYDNGVDCMSYANMERSLSMPKRTKIITVNIDEN